jgi:hypothetical protein
VSRRSSDDSNSSRLRFGSANDAQNYARHLAQTGRDWASAKPWNFPKLYTDGKLNIVVNCSLAKGFGNYDFVFSAIPSRRKRQRVVSPDAPVIFKHGVLDGNRRSEHFAVLCHVAHFVECPQGRVPSLVRLEFQKERFDVFREMFVSVAAEGGLHVSPGISKREIGLFTSGHRGVRRVIQSRSKSLDNLNDVSKDGIGDRLKLDFIERVRGFRISLRESGVRIRIKVNVRSAFQFAHLLACPVHSEVRTVEPSDH